MMIHRSCSLAFMNVFVVAAIAVSRTVVVSADTNLLMVGNSYINRNNMPRMVRMFLEETAGAEETVVNVDSRTYEGKSLASLPGPRFDKILKNRPRWDWVLVQEQSQTAGIWGVSDKLFNASLAAVASMDSRIRHYHGSSSNSGGAPPTKTVLMMTWGRRRGDESNPGFFPDYLAMQSRVTEGYHRYRDAITTRERPAIVAPVGLAFEMVYHDAYDTLGTMLEEPSSSSSPNEFSVLYHKDGSHPSKHGTYLAACVVYASITGRDPKQLTWAPDELGDEHRDYYQSVAAAAVENYYQDVAKQIA